MADSILSNAQQLRKIGSALRKSDPVMTKAVRAAVRAQGKLIAAAAADKAAEWSSRIPTTVKTTNSGIIRAGGAAAPHAAAYENDGKAGTFRHPLNYPSQGSRQHWVSQDSRPFLHPAALSQMDKVRRSIVEAAVAAINSVRAA